MAKEPEQMLEQDRVTALFGYKKARAEVAVGQQHGDGSRQHRQRQQQQKNRHQDRPHEQRRLVQAHAGSAHVEDRGDEVDGAQDRGGTRQMHRENGEVHRRTATQG